MASLLSTEPDKTYSLTAFVEAGATDTLTYRNFSILEVVDCGLELVDHCLIDDYLSELKRISTKIDVITNAEKTRYKYSPDLLAYDLYGSTQLDFVIMALNGIATPNDFTLVGDLYLTKKSVLAEFMSLVYNAEYEYRTTNRAKYNLN